VTAGGALPATNSALSAAFSDPQASTAKAATHKRDLDVNTGFPFVKLRPAGARMNARFMEVSSGLLRRFQSLLAVRC